MAETGAIFIKIGAAMEDFNRAVQQVVAKANKLEHDTLIRPRVDASKIEELNNQLKRLQADAAETREHLKLAMSAEDAAILRDGLKEINAEIASVESQLKSRTWAMGLGDLKQSIRETEAEIRRLRKELLQEKLSPDIDETRIEALNAALKDAETRLRDTKQAANDMQESMAVLGKRIESVGMSMSKYITAPLVAAGTAMGALVLKTAHTAEEIINLHASTGLATDTLQELKHVTTVAGVGFTEVADAMVMFQRRLKGAGDESNAVVLALAKIGVTATDTNGELRPMTELFPEIMRGLQNVSNETERTMMAGQLFGRGTSLLPLLAMTSEEFERLSKQAHEAGVVMGEDVLKRFKNFDDAVDMLKQKLVGIGDQFAEKLLPIMSDTVLPVFDTLVGAIGKVIGFFGNLHPTLKKIILVLGALAAALGPVLLIIGHLITAIPALIAGFDALAPVIAALTGPLGAVLLVIGTVVAGIALIAYSINKTMSEARRAAREAATISEGMMDRNMKKVHGQAQGRSDAENKSRIQQLDRQVAFMEQELARKEGEATPGHAGAAMAAADAEVLRANIASKKREAQEIQSVIDERNRSSATARQKAIDDQSRAAAIERQIAKEHADALTKIEIEKQEALAEAAQRGAGAMENAAIEKQFAIRRDVEIAKQREAAEKEALSEREKRQKEEERLQKEREAALKAHVEEMTRIAVAEGKAAVAARMSEMKRADTRKLEQSGLTGLDRAQAQAELERTIARREADVSHALALGDLQRGAKPGEDISKRTALLTEERLSKIADIESRYADESKRIQAERAKATIEANLKIEESNKSVWQTAIETLETYADRVAKTLLGEEAMREQQLDRQRGKERAALAEAVKDGELRAKLLQAFDAETEAQREEIFAQEKTRDDSRMEMLERLKRMTGISSVEGLWRQMANTSLQSAFEGVSGAANIQMQTQMPKIETKELNQTNELLADIRRLQAQSEENTRIMRNELERTK